MKTTQSILAAGIVLAAAVRSFGAPDMVEPPSDSSARNLAPAPVTPVFTRITDGPVVTDVLHSLSAVWGDYDGDGWLDLVRRGNVWNNGRNTRLYHNDGQGGFTSVSNSPMFNATDRVGYGPWADLDNDGDLDLFISAWEGQAPFVYQNQGGGEFTRISASLNLPVRGSTISWGDYDRDGFLDAFLGIWPSEYPGGRNSLLHNNGDGTFAVVTNRAMCIQNSNEETSSWVDYDNDGDLDLFAVRSFGSIPCQIYRNEGDGQFTEATPEPIKSDRIFSISSAWADFDNDGDLDLFHMPWSGLPHFYINQGTGTFSRWTGQPATLTSLPYGSPVWGDYDNDAHLDLFITQYSESAAGTRSRLFRNLGDGNFQEILDVSPVTETWQPFHPTWGDYDNDGDLDLMVTSSSSAGRPRLYRNDGTSSHWLKVRLKGTVSNSHGVGGRVYATATIGGQEIRQMRQITAQSVIQELEAHFGLGDATNVDVLRLEWPSGIVQTLSNLPPRQTCTVTEPRLPSVVQPGRLDLPCGTNVAFSLNATGAVACTYQWLFNDSPLPDATNATLELAGVQTSQSGTYRALVSDGTNAITTRPANLRVWCGPVVTNQPTNLVVRLGLNATFRVAAESLCPASLICQWQLEGTNLPGATNAILTLSNLTLAHGGSYQAVLSDCSGSTVSEPATLLVAIEPLIVQQPCGQSVVAGGPVTLSVAVTNTATLPLGYRWRRGATTITNFVHALRPERLYFLTVPAVQGSNNYDVVITNAGGQRVSARVAVVALADADGDGLPDQWEIDCGINQAIPNHGTADDDGDGLSNGQEYQCGTDPTNALSYLRVESIALADGRNATVLHFFAASNRTYTVEYRAGMGVGAWQRLADVPASASDRVVEVRDPAVGADAGQRVYRLVTPRAP